MTNGKITATTLLALTTSAFCATTQANELDFRISNDWVNAQYNLTHSESKSTVGFGYLYKDDDGSINVANIDLLAKGQTALANMPATIGIGLQGDYIKAGEFKASALAVGGTFRLNIPEAPGISVEAALFYAPDVIAFDDADELRRIRMQVNYRIIENADLSLGYKYINVGVKETGDNETIESGAFIGLRLKL